MVHQLQYHNDDEVLRVLDYSLALGQLPAEMKELVKVKFL
jgi:hypothetical protein